MDTEERLLLIHIRDATDNLFSGETVWTKPLGSDIYELRSVPKLISDLRIGDAITFRNYSSEMRSAGLMIARRGARHLMQLSFGENTGQDQQEVLSELRKQEADCELMQSRLYKIEVESANYRAVSGYLHSQMLSGRLAYWPGVPPGKLIKAMIVGPRYI